MKKREDKTLSYIDKISKEIIEALERGTAPWIKPWSGSAIKDNAPFNPITGKQYEGINFINLTIKGMAMEGDPRWMTFKQAKSLDAQVKKGEKGTAIQYWKFTKQIDKVDEEGKTLLDEKSNPIKVTVRLNNPQVFYATVFNASQIDGLRPLKEDLDIKEVLTEFKPIEAAEKILENSHAEINHVAGNRAFYSPSTDKIQLPLKEQFSSEMDYYSTALHELGHWSGHESRLNRDMSDPYGSIGYAKEELRAEIGSYMLSSKIGIDFDPSQHHAYIENWVSILEDKPSEIFKACSDASKIVLFITKLQHEQQQKVDTTLEKQEETPKESFSNIIIGATEQIMDKELELEQFQKALPLLSKGIELEELRIAVIKTQDILLNNEIEEPVKQELQELSSMLNRLYENAEQEHSQKEEAYQQSQDEKIKTQVLQNNERLNTPSQQNQEDNYSKNTYLAVPYKEKEEAKRAGAKWDKKEKSWYAPKGSNTKAFKAWSIEQQEITSLLTPTSATQALSSFKETIEAQGLLLKGEPIMNGKIQRVPVIGDKRGQKSGAYVGYEDGVPAGFIQNHKTGTKINWKATGYEFSNGLTTEDYERQKALNQAKQLERNKEQEREHDTMATLSKQTFEQATLADNTHPYLQAKNVQSYNLRVDEKGNLLMPLRDIGGKHWTNQKINLNFKGFEKNSKKEGNFFIIGEQDLSKAKELIIVEGYATGATIHEATNKTVIVAVDSGNLVKVTHSLDKKYSNATILIAGDNDIQQEMKGKKNMGLSYAIKATENNSRTFVIPNFSTKEIKENLTDFNDLAKSRGVEKVKVVIEKALTTAKFLENQDKEFQKNQEHQKMHKREIVRKNSQKISR